METQKRTLNELEGPPWGNAPPGSTPLVRRIHALREKPIGGFTVEDLRICIGQRVGLLWLVPLAIARLELDPLAEGDYFAGDLLLAVVREREWISRNQELTARVTSVVRRAREWVAVNPEIERHLLTELNDNWPAR